MTHKVLVTGSKGTIGDTLRQHLPHDTTDFDLPEQDAKNFQHLVQAAQGHDTLIHLAWDFSSDGWLGENLNPDNTMMSFNVFEAACQAQVSRVIMASSVHSDKFIGRKLQPGELLQPTSLPLPDSPYGASKVFMESLGRYYADAKGLEVVCIRFGGVNRLDEPPASPDSERLVWLSQRDCASLVDACIQAPALANNYAIVYGVSDNAGRVHDLNNPFGWKPLDGAR